MKLDLVGLKDNEKKVSITTVVMEEDPVGVVSKDDRAKASLAIDSDEVPVILKDDCNEVSFTNDCKAKETKME